MKLKDLPKYCAGRDCLECDFTTVCWNQFKIIRPMDVDDVFVEIARNITENWNMEIGEIEEKTYSDTKIIDRDVMWNSVQILCEDDEKSDTNE